MDSLALLELRQKLQARLCSSMCGVPGAVSAALPGDAMPAGPAHRLPELSAQQAYCCRLTGTWMQEHFGVAVDCLAEQPAAATVRRIAAEVAAAAAGVVGSAAPSAAAPQAAQGSLWIAPAPSLVKMRLFCLPYAGGVSENVFARWALSVVPSRLRGRHVHRHITQHLPGSVAADWRGQVPARPTRPAEAAAPAAPHRCSTLMPTAEPARLRRWASLLPAGVQVCPVEIPGRGRLSAQAPLPDVASLAEALALGLPLQVCLALGQPVAVLARTIARPRAVPGVLVLAALAQSGPTNEACQAAASGVGRACCAARRTSRTPSLAPAWAPSRRTTPFTPSSAWARVRTRLSTAVLVHSGHHAQAACLLCRRACCSLWPEATVGAVSLPLGRPALASPGAEMAGAAHTELQQQLRAHEQPLRSALRLRPIRASELARACAGPPPAAFFPAAVSPPHLYAQAVAQLYAAPGQAAAGEGFLADVLAKLRGWRDLPRELVMQVEPRLPALSGGRGCMQGRWQGLRLATGWAVPAPDAGLPVRGGHCTDQPLHTQTKADGAAPPRRSLRRATLRGWTR